MALRDWHGWQIGVLWGIGLGFLWLLGAIGETMGGAGIPPAERPGIGSRIGLTAVILLVVVVLLVVTLRWFRARLLDE